MAEIWDRPWALADLSRRHRRRISEGGTYVPSGRGPLWVFSESRERASVNGRTDVAEPVPGFQVQGEPRHLGLLPLPLRRRAVQICDGGARTEINWETLPERPPSKLEPHTDAEREAHGLMLRAQSVWDRLHDVDTALGDPARLWTALRSRWTDPALTVEPRMDVIVRHALRLSRTLDALERAPRRVLRRTHRHVPTARVQEMDRRSMAWLVRQPGETLAERAGDRQRILAVAREESFDTLENRVLRAYADLARHVARDYIGRNGSKRASRRAIIVEEFGRRCRRIAAELADRGVRLAEPGTTPNFVLQQNPHYHEVWNAWQELLRREREIDELWRWQPRSWEEFCALAVVVALVGVPGADLIAAAPLLFRDDQHRGSWVAHDNPLAVFHLPEPALVVEVRLRMASLNRHLADYAAPILISISRVGDVSGFARHVPVWPIWDARGGLVHGECAELQDLVRQGSRALIGGAVALRPARAGAVSEAEGTTAALSLTMGTDGDPLWRALERLTAFIGSVLSGEGRR